MEAKKIIPVIVLFLSCQVMANPARLPSLGVGYSNQMTAGLNAISFKMNHSRSFSYSAMVAVDTSDNGGRGLGLKLFRNFIDEGPNLKFYWAFFGGLISDKTNGISESGFQFDATIGSEISFQGLESLGLSLEAGVSANNLGTFSISTVGRSFLVAGVHFYL